ncbi:hypothetical protein BU24DRAFT_324090, partial [Aaosphaeria arxii CBS 175.79]
LGIAVLVSFPPLRRKAYELFRGLHLLTSAMIGLSLWLHIAEPTIVERIQIIAATVLWGATHLYRIGNLMYRNTPWSSNRTTIGIVPFGKSLQVNIKPGKYWKVKPGQYVYLTIPSLSFTSRIQRHPFMVTPSNDSDSLDIVIQPQNGFTKRLCNSSSIPKAWIEGPYGLPYSLHDFGTVVMFASGIGISGHLLYLQQLCNDYQEYRIKTREVRVIWIADNPH